MSGSNQNSFAIAWREYQRSLKQQPLQTKAVTAGVVAGLSDIIAQKISGVQQLKVRRTVLMGVFGFVYGGPSLHWVHKFLDRIFANGTDGWTVMKKVIIEQITYGPVCNILLMMYISMVVEGMPWRNFKEKVRRDFPGVQLNGWKVWPLAALINYRYVPIQFRVLFANIVGLFWSTFLILRSRASVRQLKTL